VDCLIGEIRKVEEEVAKVEKAFNDDSGKVEAEQAMVINGKRRENEEILAKHNKEIGDLKKSLEELNRDLAKANMDKEMATKAGSSTLATMASSTAAARNRSPASYRRAPTATSGAGSALARSLLQPPTPSKAAREARATKGAAAADFDNIMQMSFSDESTQ